MYAILNLEYCWQICEIVYRLIYIYIYQFNICIQNIPCFKMIQPKSRIKARTSSKEQRTHPPVTKSICHDTKLTIIMATLRARN